MIITNNTEFEAGERVLRSKRSEETKPETTFLKKNLISLSADDVESEPCTQFLCESLPHSALMLQKQEKSI